MSELQAIDRIREICDPQSAHSDERWIRAAAKWQGSDALLDRMGRADGEGQLLDYLAELRYALVFQSLGFVIKVEPLGRKGPELQVSRAGLSAVVEVTRLRPTNPGPAEADGGLLAVYGDPSRDVLRSLEKIAGKFRQVAGSQSVIAIWNDDEALEELEMSIAAHDLSVAPDTPALLQFVLYGSAWTSLAQELFCFPMRDLRGEVQQWMRDLEAVHVASAIRTAATGAAGVEGVGGE